ncbi:MAG: hypothetical protein ACKV19_07195 [Verrucomicrobiales bacterium]
MTRSFCFLLFVVWTAGVVGADPALEEAYYPLVALKLPEGAVIEPGGIDVLPGRRLAVGTRRGEVWVVEGAYEPTPDPRWSLFGSGLHEILGVAAEADGSLLVTHRPGIDRLRDTDGDGRADVFETVSDGWGIKGDYHEYAFGSRPDAQGNIWTVLCLTGSFSSDVPFRGWCLRVTPEGEIIPTCSGVRSPGGIGPNAAGDMFYTDNQGPWNGSSSLKWLKPGGFVGHPDGNRWFTLAKNLGEAPPTPQTKSRMETERARVPQLVPPAVYLPHGRLGASSSGIAADLSGGKFGPFAGQLFVGEQCYSNVSRVFLEKVNGVYQGAAILFREGFKSGCVPLRIDPEGVMFYGGTARGWGSRGGQESSLERVTWSGKTPFEIHEMRARPDGFEFSFTQPAEAATLTDPSHWKTSAWTYIYQADYGSPEVDEYEPKITAIEVAADARSARVRVDKLTKGHVHQFSLPGVRSEAGEPLVHDTAYYTLNEIPAAQ